MKVKDLYPVLSIFQDIQVRSARTAEPMGNKSYLDDEGCCDLGTYEEDTVYGIEPKIDEEGKPYLAILVDLNAR